MVQRRAARFVYNNYNCTDSHKHVTISTLAYFGSKKTILKTHFDV